MSNEYNLFSHNPTVSITDAPVFPILIPDEEESIVKTANAESAIGFLDEAANAMKARAALRDTPGGERTAGKIAKVFNAITGHDLTEEDAWLFLLVLKIVRSRSGKYSRDDYVDMSAYSALLGEHASTIPR
jgi:hypothetical protein